MPAIPIANGLPDLETTTPPNAVGHEWFEGLRPHLTSTGEAAKYRTALDVNCDNPSVALLSPEIGRIEREWVDEAKSYPRRARN
jgi:hypothetical protein